MKFHSEWQNPPGKFSKLKVDQKRLLLLLPQTINDMVSWGVSLDLCVGQKAHTEKVHLNGGYYVNQSSTKFSLTTLLCLCKLIYWLIFYIKKKLLNI